MFKRICWLWISVILGIAKGAEDRPNILFIAVDDLRPEIAAYGAEHIHSPNLDRFAKTGLLFERAYTSVPTCGASRASLLTGVRPAPSRFLSYRTLAQEDAPWAVPINSHFKKQGYLTLSYGKVFHSPKDCADGWSEKPWRSALPNHVIAANRKNDRKGIPRGAPWEAADAPDDSYQDGEIAAQAVKRLKELARNPKNPFFLAVGFKKPHLPFSAPQKYWDLYPTETIELPDNYKLPKNAPAVAAYSWGELRNYSGIPKKGPVTDAQAKQLIRGYYACVSFVDAQIGNVLDELKKQGLDRNTIVVIWGDHGWNLGDHTYWCKHTVYESSLHIPLIIRVPGLPAGKKTQVMTESVDLYPTLCELAKVPTPSTLEGRSLVELLINPDLAREEFAYSRYRRGDSIRVEGFRYSEYRDQGNTVVGRMLYDHARDPLENENVVGRPEHRDLVKSLSEKMAKVKASTKQP